MNLANISHLFQRSSLFQASSLLTAGKQNLGTPAASENMLQQISNQIIAKQQGEDGVSKTVKAQERLMDTYTEADSSSSLNEMSNGALEYYLGVSKFFSRIAEGQEKELISFRDNLQKIDSTIQGYQDILDGQEPLGNGQTVEDVTRFLAKAQQHREQFFNDGIEKLNYEQKPCADKVFDRFMVKVFGENKFAEKDASDWNVDASASDIYAEIDRVIGETRSFKDEMERGVQKIYNILEERGYGDKYREYLKSGNPKYVSSFDQFACVQQMMIDNLMRTPLHEVPSSD